MIWLLSACSGPVAVAVGAHDGADRCVVQLRPRMDTQVSLAHVSALLDASRAPLTALALAFDVRPVEGGVTLGDPLAGDDLAELEGWVRGAAQPPRAGVDLVVVPTLARPESAAARTLGTLRGLTLSPWAPEVPTLDVRGAYTPTVLLSDHELHGRPDAGRVVAHEVGHALGLAHDARPDNLMAPDGTGTTLDDAQRRVLFHTACPEPS